jgi:hypothetical protein
MLLSLADLDHYALLGTDSSIPLGHVRDVYFDDETWVARYFVVETGIWLDSRKVLISPLAVRSADRMEKLLRVGLTQDEVRRSPEIDTAKPVSRQQEREFTSYYGYPYYWERAGLWGGGPYPEVEAPGDRDGATAAGLPTSSTHADGHLRSGKAVSGYHVHALDGDIGQAQGLLVDERSWAVRFLFVRTGHWWHGHTVLLAPEWIERVIWKESALYVDLTRAQVLGAPNYNPGSDFDREQEIGVYGHYGRPGYWAADAEPGRRNA